MWGLIDCDNFFCSCERVFRPDLNGKPVVVLSNNDGCCVAISKEAKKIGVKMGLPYFQMLEQFPNAGITAFSSNYKLYGDMSARVMATIRDEVPVLYQYSIDECFLDLHGMGRFNLKEFGEHITQKVLKWTGIPVTLGIAPTKTLAKVATRFGKRYPGFNKCCVISTDEQREKALSMFDVEDVWGIGRRIARKLNYAGVKTAYDFIQRPRRWVKSRFHVPGERTWLELRGEDVIPVDEMDGRTKQSIMTSRSFPKMLTDYEEIASHVANYAARCSLKLRKQDSVCRMVTVFLQSNLYRDDLPQYSKISSIILTNPTNTIVEIVNAAAKVLCEIFMPGIHYKRGGVMVSNISSAKAIQYDLFDFNKALSDKYNAISQAVDKINERFGMDTIIIGAQQYDGKSMSFCNAIKRALLSPDYSTSFDALKIHC